MRYNLEGYATMGKAVKLSSLVLDVLSHLPGGSIDAQIRGVLQLPPARRSGVAKSRGHRANRYQVLKALTVGQSVTIPWLVSDDGTERRDTDGQKALHQAIYRARKATAHALQTVARPSGLQVTRLA